MKERAGAFDAFIDFSIYEVRCKYLEFTPHYTLAVHLSCQQKTFPSVIIIYCIHTKITVKDNSTHRRIHEAADGSINACTRIFGT